MRTWLILLALVALVCTSASHQEHRAFRNKRNLMQSKKSHQRGARHALGRHEQRNEAEENDDNDHHHNPEHEDPSGDHANPSQTPDHGDEHGKPYTLQGEKAKEKALAARKVVHESDAIGLGTHSSIPELSNYTLINPQLVSDVINGKSTGVSYIYISKNDASEKDLEKDENVSILFSRVSIDESCDALPLKAKDSDCDEAVLLGAMEKVDEDSEEHKSALAGLVKKFPKLGTVNPEEYVLRKMNIKVVLVLDDEGKLVEVPKNLYEKIDIEESYKNEAARFRHN